MILQRAALYPFQRYDIPDARAMEAFGQNDWRFFIKGLLTQKSMVMSGFDITNYQNIFTVPGVKLSQSNVALLHPEATTQAAGFYVSSGNEADYELVLNSSDSTNITNFVECDLAVELGTPDVRAFWDQGANSNKGAEYTATVDTVINLKLDVQVNISGFSAGKIPLYKIVTSPSRTVIEITDCRPMMFRLGTGGSSPDSLANANFPAIPDAAHARLENPNSTTYTDTTATNAPYLGGDKNLKSMKAWMDVVMSAIKEINGTPYWYMKPNATLASVYMNAAMNTLQGGRWLHGTYGVITTVTSNSITIAQGTGVTFPSSGVVQVGEFEFNYTGYSVGVFSGVTPNPTAVQTASTVVPGATVQKAVNGTLSLVTGTTLIRFGLNNATLTPFNQIQLGTYRTLFIFLEKTGAIATYGLSQDASGTKLPVRPQKISAVTKDQIQVAVGGNYVTSSGKLMVRGQEFSYSTYAHGTGIFTGVSPDPTGLAKLNDKVFQANKNGQGYYHQTAPDQTPSIIDGISEGVENCYWLAHYDGTNEIIVRDSELVPGESAAVGDDESEQTFQYIGSTGPSDNFPIYTVIDPYDNSLYTPHSIPAGLNLTKAIGEAYFIIETPIYDEVVEDTANTGWLANAIIYLPTNSKTSRPAAYTIGTDELEVYRDGVLLKKGYDYTELTNNSIQLLRDIYVDSYVRFRIASVGGSGASASGTGTGTSLQSSYNNGRTITIAPTQPVKINASGDETVLELNGDLSAQGLIKDTHAVEFDDQSANPVTLGSVGIWVDQSTGQLMYTKADGSIVAISETAELLSGQSAAFTRTMANMSGATIPAGAPVTISAAGQIELADADSPTNHRFFGITAETIPNGQSGKVIYAGVVTGILAGTGITTGYVWLGNTPGLMVDASPATPGTYLIIIGLADGNDLILQPQTNGQVS